MNCKEESNEREGEGEWFDIDIAPSKRITMICGKKLVLDEA